MSGSHGGNYEDGRDFWDIAPCSVVEVNRRFRGTHSFHNQGDHRLDDEGICTSETAVCFNETTLRYIPGRLLPWKRYLTLYNAVG
jgi:hypothetical protein